MKHTYFLENLDWIAEGTYFDKGEAPLYGEVRLSRNEREWSLKGFLEVSFEEPVRFTNDYSIKGGKDENTLFWESYNPALGTLRGTFEIIGDSIISCYRSEDGVYSGTETLIQLEEYKYYNVGVSFADGKKMSSWTTMLRGVKR